MRFITFFKVEIRTVFDDLEFKIVFDDVSVLLAKASPQSRYVSMIAFPFPLSAFCDMQPVRGHARVCDSYRIVYASFTFHFAIPQSICLKNRQARYFWGLF